MRMLKNAIVLSAAAIVLAACTDRPESAPTAPSAPRPVNLDVGVAANFTPLACDFTLLKSEAKDFAAAGGDELNTIINDLQAAKRRSGPTFVAAANDKVFDALARMAEIRGTSAQKTGVANQGEVFNKLVHRLFGCASDKVWQNAIEQDFAGALGAGWMFEVRGKNIGDVNYDDPDGVAYERGAAPSDWWAVQNANATWASSIVADGVPARVLIYGYRTDFFGDPEGELGNAFETRTIPKIQANVLTLAVKVGLCVFFETPGESPITPTQRLNHNGTFLPNVSIDCGAAAPPYNVAAATNPVNRLAQYAISFFAPKPAHAAAMFFGGSIAAAPSELSPSAVYDLGLVSLSYNGAVLNTRIGQPLLIAPGQALAVKAESPDQKPLRDVVIRLEIVGNQSNISFFRDGGQNVSSVTRKTDPVTGIATFDGVSVTKAGGFQLSAKVDVAGVVGTGILTNTFNVQNKK